MTTPKHPHNNNPADARKGEHANDPHAPHAAAPAQEIARVWITSEPDDNGNYHLIGRHPTRASPTY